MKFYQIIKYDLKGYLLYQIISSRYTIFVISSQNSVLIYQLHGLLFTKVL